MSSFMDALQNELSGNSLSALANTIGASPDQTQSAVAAALPMLLGALTQNASQPAGAQSLANALDRDHSQPLAQHASALGGLGGLLQMAMGAAQPQKPKALDGMGILGHVLGMNQQSATNSVAQQSGLDSASVLKLMSALAPVVMSSLGTVKQQNNLDAGGLSGFLQQESQTLTKGNPGLMGAFMDPQQDGVGLDDLARMGGMLQKTGILGKLFG